MSLTHSLTCSFIRHSWGSALCQPQAEPGDTEMNQAEPHLRAFGGKDTGDRRAWGAKCCLKYMSKHYRGCPILPGWTQGSREGFLEEEGTFQQGLEEPMEALRAGAEGQEEFQAEEHRGGREEGKVESK